MALELTVIDYESFFSKDYTLKKQSTESYIRDERFQAHGCAVKWQHNIPAKWYTEPEWRYVCKNEDWSKKFVVHHHAHFDGLINSHHYDIHPAMYGCTLAMSRMWFGNHISASLDSVRGYFGMHAKRTPYEKFIGRKWNELSPDVQIELADGACDEVESIWSIFTQYMQRGFPVEELDVIDSVIKMFSEPCLRGDIPLLRQVWQRENDRKQAMMNAINVTEGELQSADRFIELLTEAGVEVEYKDGKNGPIPAFAKSDDFMRGLLEDEDDYVRTLAEARIGAKSTMLQTRAETLGWMAYRGPMPVYIAPFGAGTLRFSGGDKANWQNFKRGSDIRRAICAPEGYWLAPIDLSQVEARVLAYIAGQHDLLETFRSGGDPYSELATQFYGYPVSKATPDERGTGKQGVLSCGYKCGGLKFKKTAKLGIYGPPVEISLDRAEEFVALYRQKNHKIVDYWEDCEATLRKMRAGISFDWGVARVECDDNAGTRRIYFPNGCFMIYDSLEWHVPDEEEKEKFSFARPGWRVKTRQGWKKMHSGILTQNMCEAISRIIMTQAMLRIKRLGIRAVNTTHDELLCLIPKVPQAEAMMQVCVNEMKRTPSWLPGIPLDAECGGLADRYEK